MAQEPEEIRTEIEDTRERMGETVDALAYRANPVERTKDRFAGMKETVGGKVSSLTGKADSMVDRLRGTGGDAASSMSEGTSSMATKLREGTSRRVQAGKNNPLAMLVGGAAVGFLVGTVLPGTRTEDERMGEVSDRTIDAAKDAGREALERGKETATQAVETARKGMSDTAQRVKDEAQRTMQETGEQMKETVSEQGRELASSIKEKASEAQDEASSTITPPTSPSGPAPPPAPTTPSM